MRNRVLATVAIAVLAAVSMTAAPPVDAAPTHTVSGTTTHNICLYGRPADYVIYAEQTVHFGTAHVTQCAYRPVLLPAYPYARCWQYVWNIPNPWSDNYPPDFSQYPYCFVTA